ncbi:MAG: type II CRISPR-associated endonuclease Cas1 [Atopobiaceae bacterium]|nr:type II CRISPR-associated endonuclease Cas1 [Atopobiaceae bacterium]
MGFRTVCIENRCKCSYGGGYLVVTKSEVTTRIHLSEISSLAFDTTQVYLSTQLLAELAKRKIPVIFSSEKHLPIATSLPLHGAYNGAESIERQLEWTVPSKKRLWQRVVVDKITRQAEVLSAFDRGDAAAILKDYAKAVRSGDLDNREAVAAAAYFPALFGAGFSRDASCEINASLDYGYSIVLSRVANEIASRGYLTQVGVHHRGKLNPWNLASDLMEPFRPIVDKTVAESGFEVFDTGVRHRLIALMNDEVRYADGLYKLSSVIKYYVRDSIAVLERKMLPSELKCYEIT